MSRDHQALRDLNAAWIAAVNAGDLDRLLGWVTDDVVLLGPGRPPAGRSEFAASYAEALRQSRFVCTNEVQEVSVSGDVAYTVCRDALTLTPLAGGDTAHFAGHRITIWRRQPDGRWLLARDAHTLTPLA